MLLAPAVSQLGFDPTSFATMALQGVAQVVAARARSELNLYMMQDIQHRLCGSEATGVPSFALGRVLLPNTCRFLRAGHDFLAPSFGTVFLESVRDDVLRLPRSMGEVLDSAAHPQDRALNASLAPGSLVASRGVPLLVLRAALATTAALISSTDVRTVLRDVGTVNFAGLCVGGANDDCSKLAAGLRVSLIIAEAVERQTSVEASGSVVFSDASADAIVEVVNANFHSELSQGGLYPISRALVLDVAQDVRAIIVHSVAIRSGGAAASQQHLQPLLEAWIALANDLVLHVAPNAPRIPTSLAAFIVAAASRSLPQTISHGVALLPELCDAIRTGVSGFPQLGVSDEVVRVLQFTADIASATTADEVSAIIDRAALPIGSWRPVISRLPIPQFAARATPSTRDPIQRITRPTKRLAEKSLVFCNLRA